MNRQCSFGQTNNPLENVFQHIPEINNVQNLNNDQSQQFLQNNQENIFNFNNSSGNSFQQTFNYEWNQALSGNGYGQKNTSFISEDQKEIILQQCKPKQEGQELVQPQQNNCVTSKQTNAQNLQTFEQSGDNHFSELQRLQELDYKRIQTEESSNDSLIYKGEEVDKILSRYSFQMLQENNETQKLQENNYLQNTPGSLSYSINDMKSYSENAQQQSGPGVDQDSSIHFNLKPPLGNFGQVQCFNDQNNLSNNTLNQNLINNQQQSNQFVGVNGNKINNSITPNNYGRNSQQSNPPNVYLNGQSQVLASSNINIQEYINSSKSDLFSNNLSGIKWSLMSQGSSGTYFPTSNALNNQTSNCSIKQIPSGSTLVANNFLSVPSQGGSCTVDQQKLLQKQEDQTQMHIGGTGQQSKQLIPQNNNLNFQKLPNNFSHMTTDHSFKCQECALNKQQISFLQIQLKESQEREDVQKKLNDSLMIALSQVQEEKPNQAEGIIQSGRSEILRDFYEKEIKQLREQMNNRQKQQEQIGRELVKKCDEIENQKISLELQLKDFKNKVDEKNVEINEITSSMGRKDYQIFQLSEELKKFQQQATAIDVNRVTNLEQQLDQLQKNHNNEIILMQSETEKEIQKYNLLLTKTVDSFETKIKQILTEKNLIEKANASNTEISSDLLQKLNEENIVLRQQKESAFKQIEALQKQMEQQKIQATAQSSLLSQIEEQERTIEQLQGISLAHDSLQVQYAQQAANIKHLQMKIKEVQQSYQELKLKRDNELKQSTSKYAELASKCTEIQSNSDRMKKDFQRKSAMIIREILNKDMKIRQLSQKIQIIQGNSSSPFNSSNGSNLQATTNQQKREKSPLNKLLSEDKMLSDNINFVEFNKSQLLNSPNQLMSNGISTNAKNNQQADQEKILEGLQSRSRSPVGRNTQNTQQFWLNFMDLSNISSDNLLNAAYNHLFNEEEEDNQLNGLNMSNMNTEELKSKYFGLLHQRNVHESTINELKLQLNKKNELEVWLKNEIRFVVEYLVQMLADQIVLDIREKENQTPQGFLSPSSRVYDPSKTQGNEEERIVRETDKILKQHIIKLQQKAIQSHMVECYNILNSILGANTPLPKPKQSSQEKIQQVQIDQKIKSSNKLSQSQQDCQSSSSSSLSKRALRQIDQKHNQQNQSNSPFSKQSTSQNTQQNLTKNEFSASTKLLKISQQSSLSKNNISLNASNMSNNSPTKFKKQSLKLSDLKVDSSKQKSKQQKQQSSPLIKQQNTPTRSQKIQKFGYFLSKQQHQNQSQNKLSIKTNESNLSHNLSINNNIV
ncbi:hypothetical protein ABPG72_008407 [Tetrahymena utriculariae]